MGAIKPWHVLAVLCLLAPLFAGGVGFVIYLVVQSGKRQQPPPPPPPRF